MSLAESQKFFFDLMSNPKTLAEMDKDRDEILARYFAKQSDRDFLARYNHERFATYRRHISIGLFDWLDLGFPVLRSILTEEEWAEMMNEFFLAGYNRSPVSRDVIFAFGDYLKDYQGSLLGKFPFLQELGEYEQLDMKLIFAPDISMDKEWVTTASADAASLVPVLNPLLELRTYTWPVHQIGSDQTQLNQLTKGHYPLIVYRHPKTLQAHCIEANPQLAELIKLVIPGTSTLHDLLSELATHNNIPAEEQQNFFKEAIQMIETLLQKGIVIGMTLSGRSST